MTKEQITGFPPIRKSRGIPIYLYGVGARKQLRSRLDERRATGPGAVWFLVDHYFCDSALTKTLPVEARDQLVFVDSTDEPTTEYVDQLMQDWRKHDSNNPVAVVGIGGGCALDIAKAVSNLLTNGGNATDYQGWDLVKKPGVYKIGMPTLSGTGAEASRTCVMMNYAKGLKLGMNSEFSVYDELLLDPELTATVPTEQYFYTGMDTYIHCIESLKGSYRHPMGDAYSREALRLSAEVFHSDDMRSLENREKLMIASFFGGLAIANSYVGVVHPFSAGLSVVFGTHHCLANCIVMNVMDEFYPEETKEFHSMLKRQKIVLPLGLTKDIPAEKWDALYRSTVVHEKPLTNALGPDFKKILTPEKVRAIFSRM